MLKLEKKSKSREVHVSLRESGRLLTPPFLSALGASAAIHLLGVLLFHVTPFKVGQVETIFPPVQVRIDFQPLIDGGVLAELENEPTSSPPIPAPVTSRPQIPLLKFSSLRTDLALPREKKHPEYPFEEAEAHLYYQDFIALGPCMEEMKEAYKIHVSGPLHGRQVTIPDHLERELSEVNGQKVYCTTYHIKVDDRSGKVIWKSPIEQRERKKIQAYAEKILAAIKFEKNPKGFVSEGDVQISLRLPEKERRL